MIQDSGRNVLPFKNVQTWLSMLPYEMPRQVDRVVPGESPIELKVIRKAQEI